VRFSFSGQKLVAGAVDVFKFKWDRLREKFATDDTLAGRKSAIDEYLQTIATGLQAGKISDIELGLRVNQIAKTIGLDSRQINAELNKYFKRAQRATSHESRGESQSGVDYGQGRFAAAQREVLEVLLNEPKLYKTVKQKITADLFDVPILGQAATILFETLDDDSNASLKEILARAESVELGNCIMELAAVGQKKGGKSNFESILAGAVSAIEQCTAQQQDTMTQGVDDQRKFLKEYYSSREKKNPHNVGMV
jgi:hypothetical protein